MLKKEEKVLPLPDAFLYQKGEYAFDLLSLVDTEVAKCYMDEYVVERFPRHTKQELRKLDIWDTVASQILTRGTQPMPFFFC